MNENTGAHMQKSLTSHTIVQLPSIEPNKL